MKVSMLIDRVKLVEKAGSIGKAIVSVSNGKMVHKAFGKFEYSKKLSGQLVREFDLRWPFKKGDRIILTDAELQGLFYPVEFSDYFLIPDKYGYIHTHLEINNPYNLPGDKVTLLNSKRKVIAVFYLDPGITDLNISFRINKADEGYLYFKELSNAIAGYIPTKKELRTGAFLKDNILKTGRTFHFLQNVFSRSVIDNVHGAEIIDYRNILDKRFDFFKFYPLYSGTEKATIPGTHLELSGKDIEKSNGKKFKVKEKTGTLEFQFKKKGYLFTRKYSYLHYTPILKEEFSVFKEQKKSKKKSGKPNYPECNFQFKTILNFGDRRYRRNFIFNDNGNFKRYYYPEIWRYWGELKYHNIL